MLFRPSLLMDGVVLFKTFMLEKDYSPLTYTKLHGNLAFRFSACF